jgi:pyridoxamine 5'-phosphate oxidase
VAATDPFKLFGEWFGEACESEPSLPEAMALATATPDGRPSLRMVLLKHHGPDGFTFYTNLDSQKGAELATNGRAALLFYWKSLRRQVRVEGAVEQVSNSDADAYFASRSRDSQIAAWASDQSRPLDARSTFENRCELMRGRFDAKPVPRPPRWGGYRVNPELIEFWSERPHRMHERRLFTAGPAGWTEGLLYP